MDNAEIVYTVRPERPGEHVFVVTCRISSPDATGQLLSLPAWVPGSYMIRDYARHVMTVTASAAGESVSVRKIDKSTWRVGACEGPLLIRAEIYANDLSVRGAYLDFEHAFLNGVCLFFQIHGHEHEPCVVHVTPPAQAADWQVATGLTRLTGAADEFGAFIADDYAELIDSPVLMGPLACGNFRLADAEHVIAVFGCAEVDLERIERDVACICAAHADLFGGGVPFERYVFLVMALNAGYGGLEHANSTALICRRADLPRVGDERVGRDYRRFLGLVSHEYFHLWNVKRIRPAEFVPHALDHEAYTRQLWIFEGITSYYDDLGLLRAGVIDAPGYLEMLGESLTSVYRSGGRRRQTLEESSFDAWIKFYKQDENAPNAIVSYYRKGAMVALALDLELRLQTNGGCSLDMVMRALWKQYGEDGLRGLAQGGFEQLTEELSGLDLGDFFRQALRTTVDPPVGILLAQFGVRLHMRAAESDADLGGRAAAGANGPRPSLGFRTRVDGERLFIRHVMSHDRAAAAGLSAEDELVSFDGARVTASQWPALLDRARIGRPLEICVFRRDELRRFTIEPGPAQRDTCYLTLEDGIDADVARRREGWLGT